MLMSTPGTIFDRDTTASFNICVGPQQILDAYAQHDHGEMGIFRTHCLAEEGAAAISCS